MLLKTLGRNLYAAKGLCVYNMTADTTIMLDLSGLTQRVVVSCCHCMDCSFWGPNTVTATPPLQLLTASPCSDSHPSPSVTDCITLFWQPPLPFSYWLRHLVLTPTPPLQLLTASPCSDTHPSPSVTDCITLFWQPPLPFSYWLHHLVLTATPPLQLLTASPCSDTHPSPPLSYWLHHHVLTATPPLPSVTDCITVFWQPPLPFSYWLHHPVLTPPLPSRQLLTVPHLALTATPPLPSVTDCAPSCPDSHPSPALSYWLCPILPWQPPLPCPQLLTVPHLALTATPPLPSVTDCAQSCPDSHGVGRQDVQDLCLYPNYA